MSYKHYTYIWNQARLQKCYVINNLSQFSNLRKKYMILAFAKVNITKWMSNTALFQKVLFIKKKQCQKWIP